MCPCTMYDVALMIMKHIIGLNILFVSNKVIDDLQRTIFCLHQIQKQAFDVVH